MSNHIHLIAIPQKNESLAKAIGITHWHYAKHINSTYDRSGHLWQNRFFSCPMDRSYTLNAVAYSEQNPVRARVVKSARDYPWSSARTHLKLNPADILINQKAWNQLLGSINWDRILDRDIPEKNCSELLSATKSGLPLGSDDFIAKLEASVGICLRLLPRGRPRKKNSN